MTSNLKNNPFVALFGSQSEAEEFINRAIPKCISVNLKGEDQRDRVLEKKVEIYLDETSLLEKLLFITTRKDACLQFPCVLLEESPSLTYENIDSVLFERLMLQDPATHIVGSHYQDDKILSAVAESKVIYYLVEVFERCWLAKDFDKTVIDAVYVSVINNLKTAINYPDIFIGQEPLRQLKQLIMNKIPTSPSFHNLILKLQESFKCDEENHCVSIFREVLVEIKESFDKSSLMAINWQMIDLLDFYSCSPSLASLLVSSLAGANGRQYSQCALGSLMTISCLPKSYGQSCEFFENPSSQPVQAHKATENIIGTAQRSLQNRIFEIFHSLLKVSPTVKDMLLRWIEKCLDANVGRAGIWHIEAEEMRALAYVSDGFMINLYAVLIQLSLPFVADISYQNKEHSVFKVDLTYCFESAKLQEGIIGVYSGVLPTQTTLVPKSKVSNPKLVFPKQYSFTTSCFYHTHRAINLGLQVICNKLKKISQAMGLMQHQLDEISGQASPAIEMMKKLMDSKMTLYLSLKASTFERELINGVLEFLAATCAWLVQIAVRSEDDNTTFIVPKCLSLKMLQVDDSDQELHLYLQHIPEILVENIVSAVTAVRRYCPEELAMGGQPILNHFMSFIATFMGSSRLMNNPHLRANLAECMETLIPNKNDSLGFLSSVQSNLFTQHELAPHLAAALCNVFVSIEMTGQSVAFEEKFNYRRPMYEVIKYLWDLPEHRKQFTSLASFALDNMEIARTPLFLRFINFLMNDAIFLLDEGLSFMMEIREKQIKREGSEWQKMTLEQQGELQRDLQHMSMLARFHNMLGTSTIRTLVMLTKEIPNMFVHSTLVDRMASMLNHFLTHLVGPKQRNLKVKDMEKYEFRPGEIVTDICTIYTNLKDYQNFALAIASDGRSYSPRLFEQASQVLSRINCHSLSVDIAAFGAIVREASNKQVQDDDLASRAPEEFLDPIMSSLMVDPVRLPSSQIIIDRQTIARHLLSDQTDPFNRQPLTMDQIIPDEELRNKIRDWMEQQRNL